jgi:YidC/Oxa1 family membrane protein insertase
MILHSIIIWEQLQSALEWLLNTYFGWVGNWGWAIVMLTITVRLVMLPLTIKQLRSTAAMQAIAPKIKQIQNKYKGKSTREDNQAKQAEIMDLYKEHGVNPFASCLPLLFQIPIFIGLNSVLRYHVHPTGDTGFLFISNIFVPMHTLPPAQEYFLTGLYLLSMLGSTLLFSFMTDKNQKYMMAGVAVVFSVFIKNFTVGLVIYWVTTNLWTIGQQGLIKRTMGHHFPHLQTTPEPKKSDGPRTSRNPAKGSGDAADKTPGSSNGKSNGKSNAKGSSGNGSGGSRSSRSSRKRGGKQ